jgi:hypothetical protein
MDKSLHILRSLANKVLKLEWNKDKKDVTTLSAVTLPLTLRWHAQSYLARVASAELAETMRTHSGKV